MTILLDNCVPLKFALVIPNHEVVHSSRLGWAKLGNGILLSAAEDAGFSVMITVDKSIQFQQKMAGRKIAVIYLHSLKNDLETLKPMAGRVLDALKNLQPGTVLTIKHPALG